MIPPIGNGPIVERMATLGRILDAFSQTVARVCYKLFMVSGDASASLIQEGFRLVRKTTALPPSDNRVGLPERGGLPFPLDFEQFKSEFTTVGQYILYLNEEGILFPNLVVIFSTLLSGEKVSFKGRDVSITLDQKDIPKILQSLCRIGFFVENPLIEDMEWEVPMQELADREDNLRSTDLLFFLIAICAEGAFEEGGKNEEIFFNQIENCVQLMSPETLERLHGYLSKLSEEKNRKVRECNDAGDVSRNRLSLQKEAGRIGKFFKLVRIAQQKRNIPPEVEAQEEAQLPHLFQDDNEPQSPLSRVRVASQDEDEEDEGFVVLKGVGEKD